MRAFVIRILASTLLSALLVIAGGCGRRTPTTSTTPATSSSAAVDTASSELIGELSKIINEEETRYRPLDYQYDEDLLVIIDQIEAYLSTGKPAPPPRELPRLGGRRIASIDSKTGVLRAMPRLSAEEELDHFRETIRRWEDQRRKKLRPEIDRLKEEVAARKPGGPAFHPEFHKKFSVVFDDFIPIEVAEIRERRNRVIHERAKPVLDRFRADHPDLVREQEAVLDKPPYNLTTPPAANAR